MSMRGRRRPRRNRPLFPCAASDRRSAKKRASRGKGRRAATLGDFVDIDAERGGDLLEGPDSPLSLASLELRDVRRSEISRLSQFPRGHPPILAPNAKLVLAVDDSIHDFRGDQFLF